MFNYLLNELVVLVLVDFFNEEKRSGSIRENKIRRLDHQRHQPCIDFIQTKYNTRRHVVSALI